MLSHPSINSLFFEEKAFHKMSLNPVNIPYGQKLNLVANERQIYTQNVNVSYAAGSGYPGSPSQNFKASGTIIITSLRIAFINTESSSPFQTLELPYGHILIGPIETTKHIWTQPTQSVVFNVTALENSGLLDGFLTISFAPNQDAFEFWTFATQLKESFAGMGAPVIIHALPEYSIMEGDQMPPSYHD